MLLRGLNLFADRFTRTSVLRVMSHAFWSWYIEMLLIDENKAGALLESDPNDNTIHECLLSNGRFLFQSDNANLVALYKVTGSSE